MDEYYALARGSTSVPNLGSDSILSCVASYWLAYSPLFHLPLSKAGLPQVVENNGGAAGNRTLVQTVSLTGSSNVRCASGGTRIHDPLIKSQVHLPTELRTHFTVYLIDRLPRSCFFVSYCCDFFMILVEEQGATLIPPICPLQTFISKLCGQPLQFGYCFDPVWLPDGP